MLLAQLLAHRPLPDRCGVATARERLGHHLGGVQVGPARLDVAEVVLQAGDPAAGELLDRLLATGLGEEPQRLRGQVVVLLVEPVTTGLGQREELGRAATAARAVDPRLTGFHGTVGHQVVEVPADRGR